MTMTLQYSSILFNWQQFKCHVISAVFTRDPVTSATKELLRWPNRYRDYFSCLRPREASLAAGAHEMRREMWDLTRRLPCCVASGYHSCSYDIAVENRLCAIGNSYWLGKSWEIIHALFHSGLTLYGVGGSCG